MNYTLNKNGSSTLKNATLSAIRRLIPLLRSEWGKITLSSAAILINAVTTLLAPVIIGRTVDTAIQQKNYHGVLVYSAILLGIYLTALVSGYIQTMVMGAVGRRVLFNLRNAIFNKLQELPIAFFNQNKTGDLISRINSDTDRLNQFFSQALMQFMRNFFLIIGAGIFLVSLNIRLGTAALMPALGVLILTQIISGWVKRKNLASLQSLGGMSAEIQESLNNFRVIIAFNRLDYFRDKFNESNQKNYSASVRAGCANNIFTPIYGLASNLGQLIILAYGILLISSGNLSIGLLISFLLYVSNFYQPLQQLATVWASFQQALAAFDRISEVLSMESDLKTIPSKNITSDSLLEFKDVRFSYPDGAEVLKGISFKLKTGKTYAFVGPTGGGKTTIASLMARLYDPTQGTIILDNKDIRAYSPEERTKKIGFILQEPYVFTGSLLDNIFYGNPLYTTASKKELLIVLKESGLNDLLKNFSQGLDTPLQTNGDSISLGQRQLIAFVRAVLRKPEILILDEATANIDTVTEQLLEQALLTLPKNTTKIVIAHRLKTIETADEIFFVNDGSVLPAGSLKHAVEMLMHIKRQS